MIDDEFDARPSLTLITHATVKWVPMYRSHNNRHWFTVLSPRCRGADDHGSKWQKILIPLPFTKQFFHSLDMMIHPKPSASPAAPFLQALPEKRVVEQGFPIPGGIQWIWIGSHADYNLLV
jgi:hypothetical protein